jgi:pyrroloquinoline quinone biosynthesis protein B
MLAATGALLLGQQRSWFSGIPASRRRKGPYALVLGTAQDGGLPQVGCYTPRCNRAREDPRYVASLALIHPEADRYYLVDATPDLTRQVDLIDETGFRNRAQARRPFDGIFLTHGHIGHYLGLALLGREGMGTARTPVYCTPRMAEYLSTNGPWSLMVDEGRLVFPDVPIDRWFEVDEWLSVRIVPVPHRPEFSDTVGFMFRGPNHSMFYLPDIDRWEAWQYDVQDIVRSVDVSLLDGSFYSAAEVPGRNIEDIPHPLVPHSMDLLQAVVHDGTRVVFTHLNNTNPAHYDGPEAAEVRRRGFEIARAGMRIAL